MPLTLKATTGSTTPSKKNNIEYTIDVLPGGTTATYNNFSTSVSYNCYVPYQNSGLWLLDMLGYVNGTTGTKINRVLPERDPFNSNYYCTSVQLIRQIGPDDNLPANNNFPGYTLNMYKIQMESPLYEVLEDDEITYEHERFVVWDGVGEAQNEKVPAGAYKFTDDGTTFLEETTAKTGRTLKLQAKWIDVPDSYNFAGLNQYQGRVHIEDDPDIPLVFDGYTFPAETVLFETASYVKKRDIVGNRNRDITLTFAAIMDGRTWNKPWKDKTGTRVLVTDNGLTTGTRIFQSADLNLIFNMT